ncbi:MAG: ferrochelatase [Actinomycetota bacterium]
MTTAVLLMAYGSPRTPGEVGPYFTDIRGGRPPSPQALKTLKQRYAAIGASPLNEITAQQAGQLAEELQRRAPGRFRVFTGMKHWHPFIAESVEAIADAGIGKIVGLVLAPHYSKKSIGEYEQRILRAREAGGRQVAVKVVSSWYHEPAFVDLVAANLRSTIGNWDTSSPGTKVFFSAHSIPSRIIEQGDPYADQLADSAALYASAAGITNYTTAWQSASATGEPWLGPDLLEELEIFAGQGGKRAVSAPVGFVADHLEVLFDIDVEAAARASELGIELRRIPSPNADSRFIGALANIVTGHAD